MMGKAAARAKRRKKKQTVHKLELIATHDRANDDQEHSRSAIRNIDSLVPSVLYPGILAGDKSFVNVRSQSR